jgi:hypothetical protein
MNQIAVVNQGDKVSTERIIVLPGEEFDALIGRPGYHLCVQLYIGDGATVSHSFVRKRGERLIGHAQVRTQLGWCAKEGVSRAIITHCGSEIVTGNERQLAARIAAMAHELGVEARIARDGMKVIVT